MTIRGVSSLGRLKTIGVYAKHTTSLRSEIMNFALRARSFANMYNLSEL